MATIQDKFEAFRRGDKQSGTGTRQNATPKTNVSPEEYKRMMQEAMDSGGYGTIQPYEKNKGVQKSTPSFTAPVMGGYDTVLPANMDTSLIDKYSPKIEQTIAGAVNESAAGIGGFFGGITGNEALQKFGVDKSKKAQGYLSQAKEGLGGLGQTAVDLGALGTQLLVDAAAGPFASLALFARSAGSGYNAAEEAGVDGLKKHSYALGTGAKELLSEKLFGLAKPLKKVYGGALVDDLLSKVGKTPKGKAVMQFIGSFAGEGLEEIVSNVLDVPLQQMTINPDAKFDGEWLDETLYQGLLGAVMGGTLGAPGAIATAVTPKKRTATEIVEAFQNEQPITEEESEIMLADLMNRAHVESMATANSVVGKEGKYSIQNAYDGELPAATYFDAALQYYIAGATGKKMNEAKTNVQLTGDQKVAAYKAGQADRNASLQRDMAKSKDAVIVGGGLVQTPQSAALDADMAARIDNLGKGLGMDIVIDDTLTTEAQRAAGFVQNGYYKGGQLHIAADAANPMGVVLAHEVTHRLQEISPAAYLSFRDFALRATNTTAEQLQAKIDAYEAAGHPLKPEEAMDEIAADYAGELLNNEELIARVAAQDPGVARSIIDTLKNIIRSIRARFGNQAQAELIQAEKALKLWQDAYDNARAVVSGDLALLGDSLAAQGSEVLSAEKCAGTEEIVGDDGKRFSIKSIRHDMTESKMFADLQQYCGMSADDINTLQENINSVVDLLAKNTEAWAKHIDEGRVTQEQVEAARLDMGEEGGKDDRKAKTYKQNSDPLYKISLDFSTLCRKRLLNQYVVEQLQLALERPMTAQEQMTIRNRLLEYKKINDGINVACAMCYVESARLKSPKVVADFIANPRAYMTKYFALSDPELVQGFRDMQEQWKIEHGLDPKATKKEIKEKLGADAVKEFNEMSSNARFNADLTPEQEESIKQAESLPKTIFLSQDGLTKLLNEYPDVYNAFTSRVRSATRSKVQEADVAYYYGDSEGEVTDAFIAAVNEEAGMRFSSWSDFQIEHILDYITAITELSVRGSAMHGYTKFPEFVRIFGNTGMMFNLSGVAAGEGVDADGNLLFSSVEGINSEEAIRLREEFPDTAGFQCIAISEAHLNALLDADYIDYVIPYHISGLNKGLRKIAKIGKWYDFTKQQNESVVRSTPRGGDDIANWNKKPVWSEYFVKHEDGYEAMRLTVENYLNMCDKRGLKPKFDGYKAHPNYWKLLIDRKMVNQQTGKLIEIKPVKPNFDFGQMEEEIVRYVEGYDPTAQQNAFDYVVNSIKEETVYEGETKKVVTDLAGDMRDARLSISPTATQPDIENDYEAELFDLKVKHGIIPPGENPYRDVVVQRRTSKTERVSQTVRTILEAEVTPDDMIPAIEALVADGTLSNEVYGNKKAVKDAENAIKAKGYHTALGEWLNDSRKGVMSGKHTALGWVLYNQAATAGDTAAAMTILVAATENQHNAGQAVQATRILKKLSPENQLYAVVKQAKKLSANVKSKAIKGNEHDGELANIEKEARKEVKQAVAKDKDLEWAKGTMDLVAKAVERRLYPKAPKEEAITDYVRGELLKAIAGKTPKVAKKPTTAEKLAEFLNNKDVYAEMWDETIREFRAYHRMGDSVEGNIDVEQYVQEMFAKAIVEAAVEEDVTLKNIVARVELGDRVGIANQLFARIDSKVGFSPEAAKLAKKAISSYIEESLQKSKKTGTERVQLDIKQQMREIGVAISGLLQANFEDKAAAKAKIADALVEKCGIEESVAKEAAGGIFVNLDLMLQEAATKKLEAMFKERPPRDQKSAQERFESLLKLGAFTSAYDVEAAKRLFGDGVSVNVKLAEKFLEVQTQEERDEILYELYKDIGTQLPATFREKYDAWRYTAMLTNPRTHIRNVLGNAFFVPIVGTKNLMATGLENIVYAASGGKLGKTKGLRTKDLYNAARADFVNIEAIAMSESKYEDVAMNKAIAEGRKIFKFKPLEKLRRINSDLLSVGDKVFTRYHYASALAQYCKANGITAAQIAEGKIPDAAREYAIKEAQKATYRDTNAVSQFMASVGRHHGSNPVAKTFDLLMGGVLPFRKTPANILVRGLEYSPLGLVKGMTDLVRKSLGNTKRFEKFGTDKTGAEIIDEMSAGLTGSALLALGAIAAAFGALRGGGDDDEEQRNFDALQGHQDYSLEVGDVSVTLDWLAPEILPIMVGANIWESYEDDGSGDKMAGVLTAISQISDPLLNLSCLQGINDLLDSTAYAANEGVGSLPKILATMVTSYITQGIPTVMGQGERATEENRMTTYTDKNKWLTTDLQYTLGKLAAKIPVWDYGQIPYIDAWGRPEENGGATARIANNFLNPAYTSQVDTSATEKELQRLYDATGEGKVLPDRADKKIVIESETKHLTEDEYVRYAVFKGQESLAQVNSLIQTTAYKAADDVTKADMVADAYDYANAIAKTRVSNYKLKGWYKKAQEGVGKAGLPVAQYIIAKNKAATITSENEKGEKVDGLKKYRVCNMINQMQITVPQKDYLYLTVGDYSEKTLRDTPWHGGRVSYGDGGSSSSNRSVTGSFKGYSKTTNNSGYRGDINNRFKNKSKF